ncbi:MAG: sigma-70 family RNA polymerase sigma factor [Chlorobi bacterium]|nr:sigma-70 family RNA polymerase sigma factor [Chlorobiota bacterium]
MKNDICLKKVFETIYVKYIEDLLRFLYFKTKSFDETEDLAQESFIKLWNNCNKVTKDKAKYYLFTVANRLFLDAVKHKKVIKKNQQQNNLQDKNYETPEFLMIEEEFFKKIQSAFKQMTEKQREVFELSRFEKKKYREIAEILNISVKTVEQRMKGALQTVRKYISDQY